MQASDEEETMLQAARMYLGTFNVNYECSNVCGRSKIGSTRETYKTESMRNKPLSFSSEASPLNKKAPTQECDTLESVLKQEKTKVCVQQRKKKN